jgi:putative membrane protein
METDNSLNTSMDSAKKHYSSMFSLPSLNRTLLAVAATCIAGIGIVTFLLFPFLYSILLGVFFFAVTLLADLVVTKVILNCDPIFTLRRTLVLSLVGWLFWFLLMVLGVGLAFWFDGLFWVKLSLLGYSAVLTLRVLVFSATSNAAKWRQLVSVFLQPTLCIVAFVAFWISISSAFLAQILLFVVVTPIISCVAVYILLNSIDRLGKNVYSLPPLPLFKAFLLNWVTDLNQPLEKYLEDMGKDTDIEGSLLKFDSSKTKAAIILPLVHPGPFKNIGSSLLPSLLKHEFEKAFNCDAFVPLGILGHELDLASQAQNQKIVSEVISSADFSATNALASPSVRVQEGTATAITQVFGDTVFVSFSLAPKTTEDLPQELGRLVSLEAKKYGLNHAVVVNAHNSLTEIIDTDEYVAVLQVAASSCLQKVASLPTFPFKVGSATVYTKEFSLKQGMGAGGITAVAFEVNNQKTVYVVIDGNNLISGFREKILASLASLGFDQSEVFTTDTHSVSALVTGRRGYHPVGEVMDQNVLIGYISEAAKRAASNLEEARVGCVSFTVPKVRVIGEEHLNSISILVDKALVKAKQMVAPVFGLEGLILILLLLLF